MYPFSVFRIVGLTEAHYYAESRISGWSSKVPGLCTSLPNLHLSCGFQAVIFEGLACPQNAIDLHLLGRPNGELASKGKGQKIVLSSLIELLETGLKDEMVELLMHGQHSSTVADHVLHLHQPKLIQSIRPNINSMPVIH